MTKDKDAMEKAAREHNEALRYFGNASFDAVFKNGWKAAHKGPKVMALVEALKVVAVNGEGRGMGWTPAQHARQALAEFEKESGT